MPKASTKPKPAKATLAPRPCEICAREFAPRMKQQGLCGDPACKKEKQRRYAADSLARRASHVPGLPWATPDVCALVAQAQEHPTARKQGLFHIVRTEGYGKALAIQLPTVAGESGRPVAVAVPAERVVVTGRLLPSRRWSLRPLAATNREAY